MLTHAPRQAHAWLIFDVRQKLVRRSSTVVYRSRARLDRSTLAVLAILLLLPVWALSRSASPGDWWFFFVVPFLLSVFAFFAYRSDKRCAEAGAWRVPEATLHIISLIGGWPGAFLAQHVFRHKTSKLSFQFVFWFVVAIHEFLAVDSLLDWRFSSNALRFIEQQIA